MPLIAQVQCHFGDHVAVGHPFRGQFPPAAPVQVRRQGVHPGGVGAAGQRLDQFPLARCVHQPLGGQHAGADRHHRPPHAQVLRQGAHMQAAGASEADQLEIRRVEALLNGDHPQRLAHVFIGQLDNAPGRAHRVQAQ